MGTHGRGDPGWGLPQGELMGGPAGDAYKFGLLAARLFAGSRTATT
ncbi:hypothetical protein NKH18_24130 [Streptomyces sp. M10(2022)]